MPLKFIASPKQTTSGESSNSATSANSMTPPVVSKAFVVEGTEEGIA